MAAEVARLGAEAALRMTALKLTVPGVPDVYQGDELLSFMLVDPDNRRPVDWEERRRRLEAVRAGALEPAKLALIHRLLALRARRPEAFAGDYGPLDAGAACCAFLRGGEVLVAVAVRPGVVAGAVAVPAGEWRPVWGGAPIAGGTTVALDELLGADGIAVLERA